MDNPHVQERDLAYLAGIIDGEGTITLERTGNRRISGVMGLAPKVIVANTNEAIINYIVDIFRKIGVNPHIKTQAKNTYGRNKTMYWVTTQGLTKTKKVLEVVKPYLVGKLSQAQLVLEFIEYRGDTQQAKGKPYGSVEQGILDKIRALNVRGTSETEDYKVEHTTNICTLT